jgi:DNA polymerase
MSARLALPHTLSEAAQVLGLAFQKEATFCGSGHRASNSLSRRAPDPHSVRVVEWERAFVKALLPLLMETLFERQVWLLDQRMNERGVTVDLQLVRRAQSIVEEVRAKLDAEVHQVTEGRMLATTQIEKLRAWCREIDDLELGTLNHGGILKVLGHELDLDPTVRRALEIRLEASKTSTSKLPSYLDRTGADDRMRDNFVYHGASTGRWTAQGAGLQNFPAHHGFKQIPEAIKLIMARASAEAVGALAPSLEIISACLRAMLIAAPRELIVADYNAVEARGLALLAGASKMLDIFRRGKCPYCHMASLIYHRPPQSFDASGRERPLGKRAVLGLGFQLGWETFLASCENEGIFIRPQEASEIVRLYRQDNPEIPELCRELEEAAIEAASSERRLISCARPDCLRQTRVVALHAPAERSPSCLQQA